MIVQTQPRDSQGEVLKLLFSSNQLLSNHGRQWYDQLSQCCIGRHYPIQSAADVSIRPVVDLRDQVLKLEQFRK